MMSSTNSSNSTHEKRTVDGHNGNPERGVPYNEYTGAVTMPPQGTNPPNDMYAVPGGQNPPMFMDQFIGHQQNWVSPYHLPYQGMEQAQWINMTPPWEMPAAKPRSGGKHQCQVCGSTFPTPSALDTHLRRHTGERPFICQTCQRAFNVASNLRRHERTHMSSNAFEGAASGSGQTQ